MKSRDIALALIRREAEESGELTVLALRAAQEHRVGHNDRSLRLRDGLRRRSCRAASRGAPHITGDGSILSSKESVQGDR